jgi:hypothetical protein
VAERFTGLADNARAFMASLRRDIGFSDGGPATRTLHLGRATA